MGDFQQMLLLTAVRMAGSVGFQSRSPAKEGSYLHRGTSISEGSTGPLQEEAKEPSVSPPPAREGVPIRR